MSFGKAKKALKEYYEESLVFSPISKKAIVSLLFGIGFLIADFYNLFSILFLINGKRFGIVLYSFVFIVLVILFANDLFISLKSKQHTILDSIVFVSPISIISYSIGAFVIGIIDKKKIIIVSSLLLLYLAFVLFRIAYCYCKEGKEKYESKILDLEDILSSNFGGSNEPFYVAEKDVDYDLLDRQALIKILFNSIVYSHSDHSFVIGLEGEWGVGKTTIINNVKDKLKKDRTDITIIDSFDPWTYENEKDLLSSLLDSIISATCVKSGILFPSKALEEIVEIVSGKTSYAGVVKAIFSKYKIEESKRIERIKDKIGNALTTNNKNLIIFVDNLDRASSQNIIFLMKIISVVLDIPHIVYVLSYDKGRMDEVMKETLKINPYFIEKIIHQVITIPSIQTKSFDYVYTTCINNILLYYGISKEELSDYSPIVEYITKRSTNLRHFKRMVNSVFPIIFQIKTNLRLFDLLSLQVILFEENHIYSKIYNDKQYFISDDKPYDGTMYLATFNKEAYNEEGTKYFQDLKEEASPEVLSLLSHMFPNVKYFLSNDNLKEIYKLDSGREKINSIRSAKYFELFFTYGSNIYLDISLNVESSINEINLANGFSEVNPIIVKELTNKDSQYQHEWLSTLSLMIEKVAAKNAIHCIKSLYTNIIKMDNSLYFLGINPRMLAISIIADLLLTCSEEKVKSFFNTISCDYQSINIIKSIAFWIKNSSFNDTEIKDRYMLIAQDSFNEMLTRIIEKTINLYDSKYYSFGNIMAMYNSDENSNIDLKEYISKIISESNIYRIIGDLLVVSYNSKKYTYYISSEKINKFFDDSRVIDQYLFNNEPKNESEKFVKELYSKYSSLDTNADIEKGETIDYEFKFDL